ncbi:hypothetical protein [Ulvibacter litoralis]|uniref:Lipocalin-like domain-containing protein n=1 Tax=Ulvibacter litoralis TaxID=227084 RepID=A0A1G7D2S3_9FLAO|nr:hypothetical protein [Ulvibacter litoralis]GHC45377.1 hypothetical protein GCM10008083_05190 [Ulvibacter litoralis]SDE45025.1 hypothetical protein SAMN05421855_101682 [Ulvibacter litoralis]
MKLSKIVAVLFVALSIVSCKSDDDGANEFVYNKANLEGTYSLNYFVSTEVETTIINGYEVATTTTSTGDTFQVDFIFSENGTYTVDGEFRETYTVVVNGETTEEDSQIIVISNETAGYSVSASTSLLILDGETYQVTVFNENELQLRLEEASSSNGDTYLYTEELRFTRQ